MLELKEKRTRICVYYSLNLLEYCETVQFPHFEKHIARRLSLHGYDATILVLSSAVPMSPEESCQLVAAIKGLKCAELSELWFFGSVLTKHVFHVHRQAHRDTRIRNRSTHGSALCTYLELFKERIHVWT